QVLGIPVADVRVTGGGAHSALWRQLQADVFGRPVCRSHVDEGPAYGAALLAGVACGAYTDVQEACSLLRLDPSPNVPDPALHQRYANGHEIYTAAYAAMAPVMHRLARLNVDNAEAPINI
ncbi:MAG: FGGY-family carbohydrate kinase, partial [Candidatus Dormibacteraceae bacterium]